MTEWLRLRVVLRGKQRFYDWREIGEPVEFGFWSDSWRLSAQRFCFIVNAQFTMWSWNACMVHGGIFILCDFNSIFVFGWMDCILVIVYGIWDYVVPWTNCIILGVKYKGKSKKQIHIFRSFVKIVTWFIRTFFRDSTYYAIWDSWSP